MSKEAMKQFGLALEAYHKGKKNVKIIYHRDDGERTEDFIKGYFRDYSDFSERERIAMEMCEGKILDIGAGVGPHALELQNKGYNVLAIDICEKACETMKKRGIKRVECKSPYEIEERNFDRIILLGCSIAFVENLDGLKKFLEYAKSIIKPEGLILMDSRDIRLTDNPKHIKYQKNNIESGRYRGEIRIQIEFNGIKGEKFQILHIDPDTLSDITESVNWSVKILLRENNGLYLAKLEKSS